MASVPSPATGAVRRKAKRRLRIVPLLLTLGIVGGLGYYAWVKTHPPVDLSSKILTTKVTRGDLVQTISATGSVMAQTGAEVHVGSQITGTVKKLNADVGSKVKAGAIIAVLDLPDVQANLDAATANLNSARTKLQQTIAGVPLEHVTVLNGVTQSQANLDAAAAKLKGAQADSNQQNAQTPTDIRRAETNIAAAKAALATAKANLAQVKADTNLEIATAQETVTQSQATYNNAQLDLGRQKQLLAKGFVATSVVDQATATATVAQSQVASAQQNVSLVKEKVAADLETANDQVVQAQQTIEADNAALAAAQAEHFADLSKIAAMNSAKQAVEQADAALKISQAGVIGDVLKQQDVDAARDAVKAAEEQVIYNQAQVNKTVIRSPIAGTVLQLTVQQGETLAAGLSAPTLIIVADLNRLQIDAYVDETDIGQVKLGQEADCTVDAFPKKIFKGKVIKIDSGSTIEQGVVTYDVTIKIDDEKHRLKPDMTASCTLITGKRTGVVLVPAEAVKVSTKGTTVQVYTKDSEGKPDIQQVRVKTGGTDGKNTEITDGLKEGQTIVLAGSLGGNGRPAPTSPFGPAGGGGKKGK